MVRQLGIAPSSADYRSAALLLSYGRMSGGEQICFAPSPPKVSVAGFAPASFRLEGGGLCFSATRRKADLAVGMTRAHALGATPHTCGVPVGLLASPTRNTAFEALRDNNFTTRG